MFDTDQEDDNCQGSCCSCGEDCSSEEEQQEKPEVLPKKEEIDVYILNQKALENTDYPSKDRRFVQMTTDESQPIFVWTTTLTNPYDIQDILDLDSGKYLTQGQKAAKVADYNTISWVYKVLNPECHMLTEDGYIPVELLEKYFTKISFEEGQALYTC